MSNTIQPPRLPVLGRPGDVTGQRPLPRGVVGIAQMDQAQAAVGRETAPSGTLIVGQGIHVKGQIEDCRKLVVEGQVEASLTAEVIEVRKGGVFHGNAEVERAAVAGTVEGTMNVREHLSIAAGGRACGTIRYNRISIESGGEISGEVDVGAEPAAAVAEVRPKKPSLAGS